MKIKILLTLTFAIALGCNIANSVSAAIINIIPSKDNTLYEYDPAEGDHSNGAGFHFFAGENAMGELRRGVLAFDIARRPQRRFRRAERWDLPNQPTASAEDVV